MMLNGCDHVETFLSGNFKCSGCGKELTQQEFQLKVSRQIIICKEELARINNTESEEGNAN